MTPFSYEYCVMGFLNFFYLHLSTLLNASKTSTVILLCECICAYFFELVTTADLESLQPTFRYVTGKM